MLHCCQAHARINRKMEKSTLCKIVTPQNYSTKVYARNYIGNVQISVQISSVGASPQVGEI